MSIIHDALKKAQVRLSNQNQADKQNKPAEKTENKPFSPDEKVDLTQPIRPIAGARPIQQQVKSQEEARRQKKDKPSGFRVYDIKHMNPFSFLALIVIGLLGVAMIFYIFSVKMKDKYLMTGVEVAASSNDSAAGSPAPRSVFFLSPEISLSLDGIVSSQGRNVALIDDEIVEVGNIVKGAEVIAIRSNEVVLHYKGREITIKIQ